VTGSEARSAAPLSAAERQRRKRARERARRQLEQREAELAPLRLAMAAEAERQLAAIEAALDDEQRGLPAAERLVEGAKALVLKLYGHPLIRLAERAAMPPAELARILQCDRLDAAKLQHEADRELLDRLFGKPAPAGRDDKAPPVVVNLVATPGLTAHLEHEADQGVGEDGAA
jgi:hypothetical protein